MNGRYMVATLQLPVIAIFLGISLTPDCLATERFFRNITATSANRRYVVEAISPDNADGPWRRSFQSSFKYQLTDRSENLKRWTRKQPVKIRNGRVQRLSATEGPPVAIHVSNDGWTVVRTADVSGPIEIFAIDRDGKETARIELFETLFKEGEDQFNYTSISTAGIRWGSAFCHFYFTTLDDAPCFCLRTWWGVRLVINLENGQSVEIGTDADQHLTAIESQWVLQNLARASNWQWEQEDDSYKLIQKPLQPSLIEGMRAIQMAGTMKLTRAVPYLEKLQSCPYIGSTTGSSGSYQPEVGKINPYAYQSLPVRQRAQLSLRRIGVLPSHHQSTKVFLERQEYWCPTDPLPHPRESKIDEITQGLTPDTIVSMIGTPDYIHFRVWEYDIDGDLPFTLLIEWDEDGAKKIDRLIPAKWSEGHSRDRSLAL
ncbi:hypothetical protein LOC67_15305 [Stieleria sp. JC731]|uniref:hypothetical protein n=1 Tax=Pirellulaceae TaxID=2691357 RepID=UPI001E2B0896|nr:hypothetical protein [Stieleria sp. JC731]MCC9601927.1 hypothetical protein [Stieleria sp. JC731]